MRLNLSVFCCAALLAGCQSGTSKAVKYGTPTSAQEQQKIPKATVEELLHHIRTELPKGWTCTYEEQYQWLEFNRIEPTPMHAATVINDDPSRERESPSRDRPFFAFRIIPFVSPVGFGARHAELLKQMAALRAEIRPLFTKGDFFPKTEREKLQKAKLDKLNEAFYTQPDYYYRDISLQFNYNVATFWAPGQVDAGLISAEVVEDGVRVECEKVFEIVTRPLTRYDYPVATK